MATTGRPQQQQHHHHPTLPEERSRVFHCRRRSRSSTTTTPHRRTTTSRSLLDLLLRVYCVVVVGSGVLPRGTIDRRSRSSSKIVVVAWTTTTMRPLLPRRRLLSSVRSHRSNHLPRHLRLRRDHNQHSNRNSDRNRNNSNYKVFLSVRHHSTRRRSISVSTTNNDEANLQQDDRPATKSTNQNICIIGGGLAGLATAYHLLDKTSGDHSLPSINLTILDTQSCPGVGGASSVAGGLLHPLSPKGKVAYRGLDGLAAANTLIAAAIVAHNAETDTTTTDAVDDGVVLREQLYRIATTPKQQQQFQHTAMELPQYATWIEPPRNPSQSNLTTSSSPILTDWEHDYFRQTNNSTNILGMLKLAQGCKVIHMRNYLQGLWSACQTLGGTGTTAWLHDTATDTTETGQEHFAQYDCIVYAAGSGLFQAVTSSSEATKSSAAAAAAAVPSLLKTQDFPITLVRGQSLELTLNTTTTTEAMLCGKYVAPLTRDGSRVVLGATHEFHDPPWTPDAVAQELQTRSSTFASHLWPDSPNIKKEDRHNDHNRTRTTATIDKVTTGYRVQSHRGPYGRLPIIGKLNPPPSAFGTNENENENDPDARENHATARTTTPRSSSAAVVPDPPPPYQHPNSWIFTGLSGRGILYHGLYGELLATMILAQDEDDTRLDDNHNDGRTSTVHDVDIHKNKPTGTMETNNCNHTTTTTPLLETVNWWRGKQ